ncbi:hypothetical protein HJD18_02635 [Thermoleophilia bacterium SCSIO 60948]|nr:hypothetical protein HJD18_02635 [Thermoleophilia bacterium SCSIO 60948]
MIDRDSLGAELDRLCEAWREHWPAVDARELRRGVERRLEASVARWRLERFELLTGGQVALVAAARSDGRGVVVKLIPGDNPEVDELRREALALRDWEPGGHVPRLHDVADDGLTLLMERIDPGHPLDVEELETDAHLEVLGRLARALHDAAEPNGSHTPAEEYVADWRISLAGLEELVMLEELLADSPARRPLHADLHGGNALRDGEGWRAIDPHGVAGDPNLDCWALIDPRAPLLPEDPGASAAESERRIAVYAAAADLDPERVAAWSRVRARAEARRFDLSEAPTAGERDWGRRLHAWADAVAASA